MHIEQLMSQPAITCRQDGTLAAAARLMWDHDCGGLIAVGDDGRSVGFLTDRDICMAAYTQGKPLHAIAVASAMAKQVFSCHSEESLEAAERLMTEKQVRRVPIVDSKDCPIGVLSLNDIARHVASSRKEDGAQRGLVTTLAGICAPRPRGTEPARRNIARPRQVSAAVTA